MSEDTAQAQAETSQPTPKDVAEATPKAREAETPEETITGLRKALEKANAEAKANRLAAAELDKIKESQKSDLEKAGERAKQAEQRLAEVERDAMRQRIALAKGLPADLVPRLRGDTEDDLSADADALLALVNAPRTPKPDSSQGGNGGTTSSNPADAFASFASEL